MLQHSGTAIKKLFEFAMEWEASSLLDEADVFMAEYYSSKYRPRRARVNLLARAEIILGIWCCRTDCFLMNSLYDNTVLAFRSRVHIHFEVRSFVFHRTYSSLAEVPISITEGDGES